MVTPISSSPLPIRPASAAPSCLNCPARQQCLPAGTDDEGCAAVDRLVEQRRQLPRGETLYQMKDPVRDRLYVVRSGAIKTYQLCYDGVQRIIGFAGAGDPLGLETIAQAEYTGSAVALSDSVLCELSYTRLAGAARQSPSLARQIEAMFSKELARQQATTLLLSYTHADQKLASFLLASCRDNARRGGSASAPHMPMSRQEIADYLGLTDATIRRLLSQLQRCGCLAMRQRQLEILDPDQLRAIAAGGRSEPLPPPARHDAKARPAAA